jgi:hypothetical protein
VSKIEKPDGWPRHLTMAEQLLKEASHHLELGHWGKGMEAIAKVEAHCQRARWNAMWRYGALAESDN